MYPKSWAPFAAMEKRTNLYAEGDTDGIKALEKELLAQNAAHKDWSLHRGADEDHPRRQGPVPALPARRYHRPQLPGGRGGQLRV